MNVHDLGRVPEAVFIVYPAQRRQQGFIIVPAQQPIDTMRLLVSPRLHGGENLGSGVWLECMSQVQ